jgi:hypothetical protein
MAELTTGRVDGPRGTTPGPTRVPLTSGVRLRILAKVRELAPEVETLTAVAVADGAAALFEAGDEDGALRLLLALVEPTHHLVTPEHLVDLQLTLVDAALPEAPAHDLVVWEPPDRSTRLLPLDECGTCGGNGPWRRDVLHADWCWTGDPTVAGWTPPPAPRTAEAPDA